MDADTPEAEEERPTERDCRKRKPAVRSVQSTTGSLSAAGPPLLAHRMLVTTGSGAPTPPA
eukprot:356706-Lingulodinium_polyedra.AAC.1